MKAREPLIFYSASPPSILTYKIAKAFNKNGYKTILIAMCEKEAFDSDFYKDAFNDIIISNFRFFKPNKKTFNYFTKRGFSFLKFLIKIKMLKPSAVIGISGANWQLKLVHKYFFKKYPFIYFPYDILSQFYNSRKEALEDGVKEFELNAERYCLENSDGIIHKGAPNELEFFNYTDIKLPKFQLNFSAYCSDEFFSPINKNKLSKSDKEIHIAYLGFLFNDKEAYERTMNLLDDFLNQKLHLHAYFQAKHIPQNQAEGYFKEFFLKFMKSKYFHIHQPLGPKEIIKEISKYDYSFWFGTKLRIPEIKYHIGNKISSYLEAGLPIIYSKESLYVDSILRKYKINQLGFKKDIKEIRKKILKLDYKEAEKKIILARQDFNIDKNFPRIREFIEKVIEQKNY
ncbi:hypothetical protein J4429_00970 [Candidatus Pacearchaeota archaeon]|nr:hypothetical protein [Candidatus Pacearchaeota archaeon]